VEPLTRLSEVVLERLTEYSSSRTVRVVSRDGDELTYDLFLAERFGRKEEDPYLQSGDTIRVDRSSRKITIDGEVERPGTYDLLDAETLRDLVGFYGGGFTRTGNQSALEVLSLESGSEVITEKVYVDYREQPEAVLLRDRDAVTVPSKLALMPYVFFEGAVTVSGEEDVETTALDAASRFRYRFHSGELLSEALIRLEYRFSPESDLANAYAVGSNGTRNAIDMEALLRRAEGAEDISLKPNDRFVIPFKQFFVIVAGAVQDPGRFPYIPDRGFRYYVDLAGGYDSQLHLGNTVLITDVTNRPVPQGETIAPEMKIYAPINNPLYFVNQLSGVLSVIGTVLSILAVTGVLGGGG